MQSSPILSKFAFLKTNFKPNATLVLSTLAIISFMILGSTVLAVQYKLAQKTNPKVVTEHEVLGVKYDLYKSDNQLENSPSDIIAQAGSSATESAVDQMEPQLEKKENNQNFPNLTAGKKVDEKKESENIEKKSQVKLAKEDSIVTNDKSKPLVTKITDQNFKLLTPQDLNQILFNNVFENTSDSGIAVSITGNIQADQYIQKKAQDRGYKLWPQTDEAKLETVIDNIKLQPKAREAFLKMLDKAKSEGVIIGLTSGYRSQIEQNLLFKSRFEALQMAELGGYYTTEEILKGDADSIINRILSVTAPPGHSRHHTGYTVDLSDLSPDNKTTVFNGSKAFIWMSDNNFKNARSFGFLPSYPKGGTDFGPEPEAWEFVWVGEKAI